MAKRPANDGSGDNDELQELFDSIASEAAAPRPPADEGDSDELQHLFDDVASKFNAGGQDVLEGEAREVPAEPLTPEERQESVFTKIGQMTRMLHDTLRELGYDRMLEETARQIPDARQRLSYIATMTEQAASRVLNATDIAQPIQDRQEDMSRQLRERWDKLYAKELSVEEFKVLAQETRGFLGQVADDSKLVNEQLLEIMMAQDFQDLTGQVIKKIVDMAAVLEEGLVNVLLQVVPENKRSSASEGLLNGPVVSSEGREDVVTNQEQVDDLLESLGF
ncbi:MULTISPECIES: protein phosphatase CheZ [Niveibacterium]|uniref:Protein phosphatase CheZ n=1 Tax=Niveibacterium microcysteis TaxID=2811415 RepID=A0ABX7M3H2_9RHOO|nr:MULTISPECIES: protein phosphatase CheZ [Niveibacterium]QSI75259.1 protein phosphatase CheZ [Niveibacterium microcysteis]